MLLEAEIGTAQGLLGMLGMGLTVPQEGSKAQAGGCSAQQDPAPLGQPVGAREDTPKTQITDLGCPEAGSKTLMRWWCEAGQGAEELSEPPSTPPPQPCREQRAAGLELHCVLASWAAGST